jgi:hypothetical protein
MLSAITGRNYGVYLGRTRACACNFDEMVNFRMLRYGYLRVPLTVQRLSIKNLKIKIGIKVATISQAEQKTDLY